jgi:hypothetical protein
MSTVPVAFDDFLWNDDEIIANRYEKSACALIAIKQTLEKNLPFGGWEKIFFDQYKYCREVDQEIFSRVWTDPSAYYWVRLAYQLLANHQTGAPLDGLATRYCDYFSFNSSSDALLYHLQQFSRFILALHYHAGTDIELDAPLSVILPFAIPASRLSIGIDGKASILGINKGMVSIEINGEVIKAQLQPGTYIGIKVNECPAAKHAGFELPLNPHAFNNLPGLTFTEPVLAASLDYQLKYISLVEQTLEKMHQYSPRCFNQFKDMIHYIALKKMSTGDYTNLSHSELPGTFVASMVKNPYMLAETFIHELHHNRLFFVEEKGPFFETDKIHPLNVLEYYSPWRNDLRSLHGIFHAVYVYIPVTEYWLSILGSDDTDEELADFAWQRLIIMILQLEIGLLQLQRFAELTDYGQAVFENMHQSVSEMKRKIEELRKTRPVLPVIAKFFSEEGVLEHQISKITERPLTAVEYVREHLTLYAPQDQQEEILNQMIF